MNIYYFIVLSLATWRVSKMITSESGPYKLIEKFRNAIINEPWSPVHCFKCTSIWVSFIFSLMLDLNLYSFIFIWLGLSGFAILINIWAENNMPEITGREVKK